MSKELDISNCTGSKEVFIGYDLQALKANLLEGIAREQINLGQGHPIDQALVNRKSNYPLTSRFLDYYAGARGVIDMILILKSTGQPEIRILRTDPNSSS